MLHRGGSLGAVALSGSVGGSLAGEKKPKKSVRTHRGAGADCALGDDELATANGLNWPNGLNFNGPVSSSRASMLSAEVVVVVEVDFACSALLAAR